MFLLYLYDRNESLTRAELLNFYCPNKSSGANTTSTANNEYETDPYFSLSRDPSDGLRIINQSFTDSERSRELARPDDPLASRIAPI